MPCLQRPVLHNLSTERVLFVYRDNDQDSQDVANYYAEKRCLNSYNLLAIPCSLNNVISEDELVESIENPILDYLQDPYDPYLPDNTIWVIILGYNVPTVYIPNDTGQSYMSIASRLHRLGKSISFKRPNHAYNRKSFKFFDATDAEELFITAVISGPTKESAIKLIDRSTDVSNQQRINGYVYVDPYGKQDTSEQIQYQDDILEFVSEESSYLGLTIEQTTDEGDIDPTVFKLERDSFYWGWFNPVYSRDLFVNQNERRVFLYNADDTGCYDITQDLDEYGSDPWPVLAINVEPGYATTAGAVDSPGEDSYLRPRVFFEALQQGCSIGEAFLYASPHVDWKIFLVGDPLTTVLFPLDIPLHQNINNTLGSNYENIDTCISSIETSLAYAERQDTFIQNMIDFNVESHNLGESINLLYGLNEWKNLRNLNVYGNFLSRPILSLKTYILESTRKTLGEWLADNDYKISILLNNVLKSSGSGSVDESLIYDEGHWSYDFVYTHPVLTYEKVFFVLQLSTESSFATIYMSLNSQDDETNWKYEKEISSYEDIPSDGMTSNFSGRRVMYESTEENYLNRTDIYYIRWKAIDSNGNDLTSYETDTIIIRH